MSAVEDLTRLVSTDADPASLVARYCTVLRTFDHRTQDSGNVSWLVEVAGRRLFVKSAGSAGPPAPGAPVPYLDHAGRVRLLRNAVDLARSCHHRALPSLLNVIESPSGPALVYEAVPGELVHVPRERRSDPASSYRRFANLPAEQLVGILGEVLDLHVALAAQGWVAVDLYDGCMMVDFDAATVTVVDLDTYRRGPSTNDMGRMFGSSTFMAPEEFQLGAKLDQRTTVFTLGRLAWHFGTRLTEREDDFCGGRNLAAVVHRACAPSRSERFATVAHLHEAWTAASTIPLLRTRAAGER